MEENKVELKNKEGKKVVFNIICFIASIPFAIFMNPLVRYIYQCICIVLNIDMSGKEWDKASDMFLATIAIPSLIILIPLLVLGIALIVNTIRLNIKLIKKNKFYIIMALVEISIYFELLFNTGW